jgi:RNA recognition motif-containing protein
MKLYVGNLPYQATESDLQDWLTQAGITPDTVTLVRDRITGEARGFGFIEFAKPEAAEAAISACNGKQFMGRALVVNEARPPAQHGGGGGGRQHGGGGGKGGQRRPPRW